MGKVKKHPPVKLISGFIYKNEKAYGRAKVYLENKFGRVDFESEELSFHHTDYYRQEFGGGLKRRFVSFKKLILPEALAEIKKITNQLEGKLSLGGARRVNIDPGYIELAKLVLATTKDYKHRAYLRKGIFAEITLFYQDKTFRPWEWTYPDYQSPEYIAIFNRIREIYLQQISS